MSDPAEVTFCELTGKQHCFIYLNGERVCYWCKRPMETCCEGEAGRETERPPEEGRVASSEVGRLILDRAASGEYGPHAQRG